MSDAPADSAGGGDPKSRRWFVILAIVTLIGFALFVGAITVCAARIPELKRLRYGGAESGAGVRPA